MIQCGQFAPIFTEYLEGWAAGNYRNLKPIRSSLIAFGMFLVDAKIPTLGAVTPRVITEYLAWGRRVGRLQVPRTISTISMFFNWMIVEERREASNPVVSKMHSPREPRRRPRPLSAQEESLAWEILDSRGTNLHRLVFAIGIEAGLRIGEIVNLRLSDIDTKRQAIFVRIPNKTMRERWTFFHEKTLEHLDPWLQERSEDCDHDFLFHNVWNRPLLTATLALQLSELFCDPKQEKRFEKWSTHRLRHSMATSLANAGGKISTISALGGWSNLSSMLGYIEPDLDAARAGYLEAVEISKQKIVDEASTLSMDDFVGLQSPTT
jgi:integrase